MKTLSKILVFSTMAMITATGAHAKEFSLSHSAASERISGRCNATCTVVDYYGPVNKLTNTGSQAWADVYEEYPGIQGCRLAAATACSQPNFPCRALKIKVDLSYDLFPGIDLPPVSGVIVHRCSS